MSPTADFVVAPDGDDANDGSLEAPFATLERAREAVRQRLRSDASGDLLVHIRHGRYELAETFVLGPEDSPVGGTVTYAAYPGETATLSGGQALVDWRPLTDPPTDLPAAARGSVWVADVPASCRFHALFDNEGLLTRAHSEDLTTDAREGDDPRRNLRFQPGDVADWRDLSEAELFIIPEHPWVVNYLTIAHVDEAACIATTDLPATYRLITPPRSQGIQLFYRIENRLAYLDGPGQWVLDSARGKLYLWPRTDRPEGIIAPHLKELVRIEGDFDRRAWAHNIRLEGLTLSHCDRMVWGPGRRSLQHDWEFEDTSNALVRLRGAERVQIRNCFFAESGSGGVRLDLHASDNLLSHNEFRDLGGTGVALLGYGPGSRDENHHNTFCHNHIHRVGRLWWHSSGIFISQSGHNRISDNLIHSVPYTALVVSGPRPAVFDPEMPRATEGARTLRWDEMGDLPSEWWAQMGWKHSRFNVIEHNEIHHAMEWLGDGNGIYLSGTGEGNVVRRNYVHGIPGAGAVAGIRNDDWQFFTLIEENVVWQVNAAGVITKHVNQVENNILVDCYGPRKALCYLSLRHGGPSHGAGLRRNILFRPADGHEPQRPFIEDTPFLAQAATDDNLLWCELRPQEAEKELLEHQGRGKCLRSMVADPLFFDAARGDFRLRPDSPAFRIGFRPVDHWGLRGPVGPDRHSRPETEKNG